MTNHSSLAQLFSFGSWETLGYHVLNEFTPPSLVPSNSTVIDVLAVLVRLFYWGYTGRTWEDALITVLHSENAASGLGLTHLAAELLGRDKLENRY